MRVLWASQFAPFLGDRHSWQINFNKPQIINCLYGIRMRVIV